MRIADCGLRDCSNRPRPRTRPSSSKCKIQDVLFNAFSNTVTNHAAWMMKSAITRRISRTRSRYEYEDDQDLPHRFLRQPAPRNPHPTIRNPGFRLMYISLYTRSSVFHIQVSGVRKHIADLGFGISDLKNYET